MHSPSDQKREEQVIATNLGLILDIERLLGQPHAFTSDASALAERLSAKLAQKNTRDWVRSDTKVIVAIGM